MSEWFWIGVEFMAVVFGFILGMAAALAVIGLVCLIVLFVFGRIRKRFWTWQLQSAVKSARKEAGIE